jgi:serine/threonine protein kinase/tetratricopeptide (TPR) repeat protein
MHDSTDSGAPNGDRAPLPSKDLTAPLVAEGTIDHPSAPLNGAATGEFRTEAIGTIDHAPSADPGMTCDPVGDHTAPVDGAGGTVDHTPSDDAGFTVDPAHAEVIDPPTVPTKNKRPPIPKSVAGYDVLGVLGRGAMGVVYKARQRGLNRLVALKMILSGTHASEHELGRFRTEAEAVARIQHPNIVQIYEVGEEDGRPFFSLEFVDGGTLNGKIDGKPQPPDEAAQIMKALAAGMDCAHRANVIHRDLKPANVLLAADGTPKITDFGLAKRLEEDSARTNVGSILGTPGYMSPEQAGGRNDEVGPLSDVYSLGVILYELLTGRVPFQAPKILDTLEQVRNREPVAPTELQPKVPRDLETICLKCLQKDPSKRYASAGALEEDLRRYLNNEPILARPVGWPERAWRWCRRNPRVAGMSAGIAVLILGYVISVTWLMFSLKQETIAKEKARIDANEKAELAKKNESRANREAELAKNQYANAVDRFTLFGEALQQKMQGMGTAMLGLRADVMNLLKQSMLRMANDLEQSEATTFATAGSYQRMGDILRGLGQGEEAMKQFHLAHEAAQKSVLAQPNNDKARANLGIVEMRFADMDLELNGEARAARDLYEKLRKMRQEIADHPRSGDYDDLENKINVAHYHLRLAKAELALGDSLAARNQLNKTIELRKVWTQASPDAPDAHSYLMEAYMWLGVADSRLGDVQGSREAFAEALRISRFLIKKYPGALWFQADLAELLGHQGDAQMRLAKTAEAKKSYQEALNSLKPELERLPNRAPYLLEQASLHERLAVIARLEGDSAGAKKGWEESLRIRAGLIGVEPKNLLWLAGALRASANCGRFSTAVRQLEKLYRQRPHGVPILLDTARACAAGVALSGDAAAKQRYVERAVGALHAAVLAGYKDSIALKTDPELAPLQKEPLFRSLLAELPNRVVSLASP